MNPNTPYNELPLLPPELILSEQIYKRVIAANKLLAELKGMARVIPNQTIIINSLTAKEAKDSSEIENIITTQDELYKAMTISGEKVLNPNVKEVLNYREALWDGYKLLNQNGLITIREILAIQERLTENNAGIRKQPGTALKNSKTGEVVYTPPSGEKVIREKLKNLEQYINTENNDVDPLVKLAIIHYQFEAIHPFYDGNGRTGRILNVLFLIHQKLLDLPILYLSSFIIKNKNKYYRLLNRVSSHQEWEPWVLFMLESVEDTAKNTLSLITSIKELFEITAVSVQKKLPKIYSKELIETLFIQPYCKIQTLENNLSISRFTASKYLKELEGIGVLKSEKVGRDIIYINTSLFQLLKK